MSDHLDPQAGDQSETAQQADMEFQFRDESVSEEGSSQRDTVKERIEESMEEDDFYRGGGATTGTQTTQSLHLPDRQKAADMFSRILPLLFGVGLISALIVAAIVGVSTWITFRGMESAMARAIIGGGGLLTGSVFVLYIGWILGTNSI